MKLKILYIYILHLLLIWYGRPRGDFIALLYREDDYKVRER